MRQSLRQFCEKKLTMRGVHLKLLPRSCPICPEKFNSSHKRTKHLRIVHNKTEGVYKCDVCGKEFELKYLLQLHIRSVHYQEKNEECPVCKARFFSKYRLNRHLLVHTGIKNFRCNVCGKAYVKKAHLNQHSKESRCRVVPIFGNYVKIGEYRRSTNREGAQAFGK